MNPSRLEDSSNLADFKRRIDAALDSRFAGLPCADLLLRDAMSYACTGGGKRLRGALVLAAARAVGGSETQALAAACAVEAMHAYSLVHDDLPCMDDDDLRRGRPTCHKVYGEAMALLAGDALQTLAFDWLSDSGLPASQVVGQVRVLAQASGVRGMAGGQAIDLQAVNRELDLAALKNMHACKTGALIKASVLLGALCVTALPADVKQALETYADRLGLAFQVVDDILDVSAPTENLGKTAGKDARDNKPTMVSLLGLEPARELAHQLAVDARLALAPLGDRAGTLATIIDLVVERHS